MTKRYRVLPYSPASKSAKALAVALGGKRLKLMNSSFVAKHTDVIINWGNPSCPWPLALNASTLPASNKLKFMLRMKDTGNEDIIPRFWTSKEDIPDDAFPVVCRKVLNGHSGSGIIIAYDRDDLVECQLYVQYIKKKEEYRVHIGKKTDENFKTICIQRKARRLSCENPNWQIRSHDNGFVFVRNDVDCPASVEEAAHAALEASGLDFGAVDIVWNDNTQKAYVLEINTAPGLEGTTIQDYANYFKELT